MDLQIKRGESCTYNMTLRDLEGGAYYLQAGEILRLGVKRNTWDKNLLIEKELTAADLKSGVYPFRFTPEDTLELESGSYVYDVGVQSGDDYFFVIGSDKELPKFEVLPSVTKWEEPDGT